MQEGKRFQELFNSSVMNKLPPIAPIRTKKVKIPAPTRSPLVMGAFAAVSGMFFVAANALPAFGSPILVPPVAFVTGAAIWCVVFSILIIEAYSTPTALICCPIPVFPSNSASPVHLKPHAVFDEPPLQACAAAEALEARRGRIVGPVKGARMEVAASQPAK